MAVKEDRIMYPFLKHHILINNTISPDGPIAM
jgi:hypothetical protein